MRRTVITCNHCAQRIKTEHSGGRVPNFVNAMFEVPTPHFTVTNNKGEVFDFCSKDCIELGDFE